MHFARHKAGGENECPLMGGGSCKSNRFSKFPLLQLLSVLFSHEIMAAVANLFIYLFIIIFYFLLRNLKSMIWDEGGLRIPEGKTVQRVKSVFSRVISKKRKHHRLHQMHLNVY